MDPNPSPPLLFLSYEARLYYDDFSVYEYNGKWFLNLKEFIKFDNYRIVSFRVSDGDEDDGNVDRITNV